MENTNFVDIIRNIGQAGMNLEDDADRALVELREIAGVLDEHIPYYDGHALRVCDYSLKIGKALGISGDDLVTLEIAALFHDVGKITLDKDVLMKSRAINETERQRLQSHALRGYYILEGFENLEAAAVAVRSHHESYDGSGYPFGLAADRIALCARIIAVADAFDAMTSKRPYRKALSRQDAMQELTRLSGVRFDPQIVGKFIKILISK
jgi:HD-GYP domain-containing protein (c-di-GMP phosphodiesterase class II)